MVDVIIECQSRKRVG